MGVGGDVQEAFAQGNTATLQRSVLVIGSCTGSHFKLFLFVCLTAKGPRRNLRNDLLIAADSITNTMSSLVKELNSGKDEWRENSSHIQTYYTLTVFIIFFFNKQRVEVKRRALWIQILDVNYWPQTPQILSTLTNQGTFKILQKQPCY